MGRMTDEDVGRLLRELPRGEASRDFVDRVLVRLNNARLRNRPQRRRRLVLSAAALVTFGLALSGSYLKERYERSRAAERVEALREEYRTLQVELEKLRALTERLEPVLELGGTDDVDFVLDLRELARASEEPNERREGVGAEPVSHSESRPERRP